MSSSENNTITLLNDITDNINRYFTMFILLFGCIGNILNIFVLSQRNLRTNPCGWFFLISSIFNLLSIMFGVSTRLLSGWNVDPTKTIDWFCKLRTYIVFSSRSSAFWLIMFATIDRWLSSCSNVHYRQMSTLKNAQKISLITTFIISSIHLEIFYCYEANLINTPLFCYGKTNFCRILNDMIYIIITILIPLILMIVFGLLTILNVRQTQRRVQVVVNRSNSIINRQENLTKKKIDRHLLRMLLVEIVLLILLLLPQAIQKIYTTATDYENKSIYNIAIDHFLYNIVLLLTFIGSGIPFYIYTLFGGEIFKKALFNICRC